MTTNAAGRALPLWLLALLAAVLAAVAVAAFGGESRAQAGAPDPRVTKTVKPKTVTVGEQQVYNINVTNQGNRVSRSVVLTDPLPRNVRFIRASTSRQVPGSCGNRGGTVRCQLGNIQAGDRVNVKIFVRTTAVGRYVNRVFIDHATAGLELDRSDNSDTARHRTVRDRDRKKKCGGVQANPGNNGAQACANGVVANARD